MPSSSHELLASAILYSFIILTLSCFTLTITATSASRCHVDDETGLLAFKSGITSDPSHMLASWIKGTDCCQWYGIDCLDGARVTTLSLYGGDVRNPSAMLSGTISPSLSKLQFLSGVFIADHENLHGPFPNSLLSLPRLRLMYIQNNKLSGPLPTNIGQLAQLEALGLSGNQFSGPIPPSIGGLTQLNTLMLDQNHLTGTIPVSMKRLRNLTLLALEHNQLSGQIPDIFSGFSNLWALRLSYNNFSGKIPPSISALAPVLSFLEMGHNSLTGSIPKFLGAFRALNTLDLSFNRFSGAVPQTFANLTNIYNLDLSHNLLVDPFPQMFVTSIQSLDLSYNKFARLRTIPEWVTNSAIIYSLRLANCGLKFKLENWKPTTEIFNYIDLSGNNITGSPVKLLNSTHSLVGFYASGNRLKFHFERLKFADTLKELDLSHNLVIGKVPEIVSTLDKLNVSYNHLCGRLPATKFPVSAFAGNDCLCGSPLPKCKV